MKKWKKKVCRNWEVILEAMSTLDWEGPSRIK